MITDKRLNEILEKPGTDWSADEVNYVIRVRKANNLDRASLKKHRKKLRKEKAKDDNSKTAAGPENTGKRQDDK